VWFNAAPHGTVLAVGAHSGDVEVTSAALLARQKAQGDRIVILHLTLGERGNPRLSSEVYGRQKRREAEAAAKVLGAEVIFGPYRDGEIPDTEEARRYVAGVIRKVRPTHVLTHWKNSVHRDHSVTSRLVDEAVLLASLEGYETGQPPHRGVRSVWYTDNWEDAEGFRPYLFVDVTAEADQWRKCVTQYEFIRGGISSFPYLDYYDALATVRGAVSGKKRAVAFDVEDWSKKRVLDSLP
jgi:LmbE family N-acetylglucosaminyl deacetylase